MAEAMQVWFVFKHDVRMEDGQGFICAKVHIRQPSMPGTGLWGFTEIDVWVPFSPDSTMAELREAAIAKAQDHARQFADLSRSSITFESGHDIDLS